MTLRANSPVCWGLLLAVLFVFQCSAICQVVDCAKRAKPACHERSDNPGIHKDCAKTAIVKEKAAVAVELAEAGFQTVSAPPIVIEPVLSMRRTVSPPPSRHSVLLI